MAEKKKLVIRKKKDILQHMLDRPDTYVGSDQPEQHVEYILEEKKLVSKKIEYVPALLQIFHEIRTNVIDNVWRSSEFGIECKEIEFQIDEMTGRITIQNDGLTIPVEFSKEEGCNGIYQPELVFGVFWTSSNYDDSEERKTSGRNGYGAKVSNAFSLLMEVETYDPDHQLLYKQRWRNNMSIREDPVITKVDNLAPYTQVSWIPDFKRLNTPDGYSDDMIKLMKRFMIDTAMITKVPVIINNERVHIKSLEEYAQYFSPEEVKEYLSFKTGDSEVVVIPNPKHHVIAFTNGAYNSNGGVHVDVWTKSIFTEISNKFNPKVRAKKDDDKKKAKDTKAKLKAQEDKKEQAKLKLTYNDVKKLFSIFINCSLDKPKFDTQSKTRLTAPKIEAPVDPKQVAKVLKWDVALQIKELLEMKQIKALKKIDSKKKYVRVEGLENANLAGTSRSGECTLILCEGKSAKTFAVTGIGSEENGRDKNGILALKGKCVSPETDILLWDGTIKEAKNIKIGDIIIGDNGEKRYVESLTSGEDNMYKIKKIHKSHNMGDYIVNSQHTLTLKYMPHCKIGWLEQRNAWCVRWLDRDTLKMKTKYVKVSDDEIKYDIPETMNLMNIDLLLKIEKKLNVSLEKIGLKYGKSKGFVQRHNQHILKNIECKCGIGAGHNQTMKSILTKEQAYEKLVNDIKDIPRDNVFDLTINQYQNLEPAVKSDIFGFYNNQSINWEHKDVLLDPYILGMWLGDGMKCGRLFASADQELIDYWTDWANKNEGIITKCQTPCAFYIKNKNNTYNDRSNRNPLRKILEKYDLINNKYIPNDYLINDKETRLKLLAGIIDTDGYVMDDGRIEISQGVDHTFLIKQVIYLARSLGFYCSNLRKKKTTWEHNGEKKEGIAYRVSISGYGLDLIPTLLIRKKCISSICATTNYKIEIESIGMGKYVGFSVNDNHRFLLGDFTVTHNCLNVRKATQKQITSNKIIQDIIQAIRLKIDVDYTLVENFKDLAYGRIMVICDSDVDGSHIEGLLMNLFHRLFPSLFLREEPFFISMRTPLVRVYMKNGDMNKFYSQRSFKEFYDANILNIKSTKYFKGLGTNEDDDIRDCFGERLVEYEQDEVLLENMNKAFGKSVRQNTDLRKKWIGEYDPNGVLEICDEKSQVIKMNCSDFINNELILFSIDDCARSIPWIDGLKVSQRKILYTCIKEKLRGSNKQLKVAQLAGAVAKLTQYHHGEQCLFDTIIGMAQDFVGANNIPLLEPIGQFGSRSSLGDDAAQARYIFTRLANLTKYIYRDEDNDSLEYMEEDGEKVEPKFFVPIIPMTLINGACGIGTGWSTNIPNFNPIDIINAVRIWIKCDGNITSDFSGMVFKEIPETMPWYDGFVGNISKDSENRYITNGIVEEQKGKKVITELPIGMATDKFRDTLDKMRESKMISSYKDYSTKHKVKFIVSEKKDGMVCNIENMKLRTYLSVNNMVLFNQEGKIKKYDSVEQIIDEYCWLRFKYYQLRKERILKEFKHELLTLNNKYRFVNDVMDEKILVFRRKRLDIVKTLEDHKYDKIDGEFMYLLRMHIDSFTTETIEKLKKEIDKCKLKIDEFESLTIQQIWLNELDELETEYNKYKSLKWKKIGKNSKKIKSN